MRRRVILIAGVVMIFIVSLRAQDSLQYQTKWMTRPTLGMNFPIVKLLNGKYTDDLFQYDDQTTYWQIVSAAWFFRKHWGVEFTARGATSSHIPDRDVRFYDWVQKQYGAQFHLISTGAFYDFYTQFSGDVHQFMFGVLYRWEKGNWSLYPKLAIGETAYDIDQVTFRLKEKNGNVVYDVRYTASAYIPSFFTVVPSMSGSYRLTRRLAVHAELAFAFFRNSLTFERTIANLHTGESTSESYDYTRGVLTLSAGAGLTIVLKSK